jgi:hypothetical protein
MDERILESGSDRKFWKFVKGRFSPLSLVPALIENGETITDDKTKADMFNEFFCSVFVEDNGIALPDEPLPAQQLTWVDFDENVVLSHLQKLKPKLSSGPDGLPQLVLQELGEAIATPLSYIFNLSFRKSKLPDEWKIAKIIPIHKKALKSKVSNYRPVSMLSSPDKVMESIVCGKLVEFLENNSIFSQHQFGFRKKRSTVAQLLLTYEDWTRAVDSGFLVDVFFIDITKAFDTVSHVKLVKTLQNLGIDGTLRSWISDYLRGRKQHVQVDKSTSSLKEVVSGVPQGSHLGPVLFLLFINDLEVVLENMNIKLFADDAKLYFAFEKGTDVDAVKRDLDNVVRWCEAKQLQLAFSKCCVLHLGFGNPAENYFFGNQELQKVKSVKDLGVTCI